MHNENETITIEKSEPCIIINELNEVYAESLTSSKMIIGESFNNARAIASLWGKKKPPSALCLKSSDSNCILSYLSLATTQKASPFTNHGVIALPI